MVASTDAGWLAAKAAINHWLLCYNKDPVSQTLYYHKQSDADYVEKVEKRKAEIDEELTSLSAFENQLLERMIEVSSETDDLFTFALRLLAGRSLVDFANSFVSMGLALALNNRNDEDAAYGALVAALYGQTQIDKELEALVLKCSQGVSSKLRAPSIICLWSTLSMRLLHDAEELLLRRQVIADF